MRSASTPHPMKKLSFSVFVIAVATSLAFSVQAWRAAAVHIASATSQPNERLASAQIIEGSQAARLDAELITLRPSGFEPSQLSRLQGRFVLAVDNQTGLENLTLRLERGNGVVEQEVRLPGHRPRWRARLNLPAGDYFLKVAGHAGWVCRIRIG